MLNTLKLVCSVDLKIITILRRKNLDMYENIKRLYYKNSILDFLSLETINNMVNMSRDERNSELCIMQHDAIFKLRYKIKTAGI